MKEVVIIEEICEDGSFAKVYEYDTLPENVRSRVDEAVNSGYDSTECDVYQHGLQFLMSENHPEIKMGEKVVLKANVQFYG